MCTRVTPLSRDNCPPMPMVSSSGWATTSASRSAAIGSCGSAASACKKACAVIERSAANRLLLPHPEVRSPLGLRLEGRTVVSRASRLASGAHLSMRRFGAARPELSSALFGPESNVLYTLSADRPQQLAPRSARIADVAPHHGGAELGKFFFHLRRAGVVGRDAPVLGREAEGDRDIEIGDRLHLPVEPVECVGAKTVGPGQARAQMLDAEPLHPGDGVVEPVVLEVKPLADAHLGR